MNPHRKVKSFHITVKGHYMFNVPVMHGDRYFYCFENGGLNDQEHTHCGVNLEEPMSKVQMLAYLRDNNEDIGQPDVAVHQRFSSVIGYHYGEGGKDDCDPSPFWPEEDFDYDKYLKTNGHLAKRGSKTRAKYNQKILSQGSRASLNEGLIGATQYISIDNASKLFIQHERAAARLELPTMAPIPAHWHFEFRCRDFPSPVPKQRHLWLVGMKGNEGKTYFAWEMAQYRQVALLQYSSPFFAPFEEDTRVLIADEYNGASKIPYDLLNKVCDGYSRLNKKGGWNEHNRNDHVVIILSNKSLDTLYPDVEENKLLRLRFEEVFVGRYE